MAIDFSQLKAGRKQSLSKLLENVQNLNTKVGDSDQRHWKLTVDKAGNGAAIIRFLPSPKNEDSPFIRYWDHGFKGPGGWYIEKSRTTLGDPDPVSEHNSELWNSGLESDKDIARNQKRRLHYVSNILVIRDPAHPENDGKVFLYEYGVKIFVKITDISTPDELGESNGIDPHNFWEGANFRLRAQSVKGSDGRDYRNYDKSAFDSSTPIAETDEEIEKIWNQQYSLQDIISADKFKSYDDLKKRLHHVLGTIVRNTTIEDDMNDGSMEEALEAPKKPGSVASEPMKKAQAVAPGADVDDDEEYFRNIAGMDD